MWHGKDEDLSELDEVWHELVLNGIGGCTIAEAQEHISYVEFRQWVQYRRKRGTLNMGRRIERGAALLAVLYRNAHLGKGQQPYSIWDFMPNEEEPEITLDKAMEQWK